MLQAGPVDPFVRHTDDADRDAVVAFPAIFAWDRPPRYNLLRLQNLL